MKLNCFSIGASVLLATNLVSGVNVNHPSFTPFDKSKLDKSSFFEQFDYITLLNSDWKISHAQKDDKVAYFGKWNIEEPTVYPGFENDKGLVLKTPAAHHAISYKLEQPFDNTDNDLVLQYEIKLQDGLECGGTYIKLLDYDFDKDDEFNNDTPYQVMFGPDKCGSENKIHFILRRFNPISKEHEEKHLVNTPMSRTGKLSTLYTLILKKNQDFEIRINGEVAKAGNLIQKPKLMKPPLNPPKEIVDKDDFKPIDWDDRKFIPDPEQAEKPDDYDIKHGLSLIPDPNAVKPADWNDDEPEFVEDPSAHKPEEWDDDEDGVWLAPEIPNPKCSSGCGTWEAPLIINPTYVGPWIQPVIPNPNYNGEWKPRSKLNPNYFEDLKPSNLELIGGLGFELWSMDGDILFDNIYLGHSIKEAELIGNKTYSPKYDIEEYDLEHNKPPVKNEPIAPPPTFEDFVNNDQSTFSRIREIFSMLYANQYSDISSFYYKFMSNPVETIIQEPVVFFIYCCAFVSVFTFAFGIFGALVFMVTGASQVTQYEQQPETIPKINEPDSDGNEDKHKIEDIIDDDEVKVSSIKTSVTSASKRRA